jgi:hypothetical protein
MTETQAEPWVTHVGRAAAAADVATLVDGGQVRSSRGRVWPAWSGPFGTGRIRSLAATIRRGRRQGHAEVIDPGG